ncbi:MAG: hypothetical protein B7Y02_14450, partial [Rhodobacterales bacterium 17-64-5]
GLFFLAVGMALDLSVVAGNWQLILVSVVALTLLKMFAIYMVARAFRASHHEAVERLVLMAQGGEFAFVLYTAALSVGLIDGEENATLTAIIILSMVMTPIFVLVHDRFMPKAKVSTDGLPAPEDDGDAVLLIGFGRFGQVVTQPLLRMGYRLTIIDTDPEAISTARAFGFMVYFGDGTRLDILRAAGASHARAVVIAIDNQGAATRIAHMLQDECPLIPVFARSFDRRHSIQLIKAGVEEPVRETFESALVMSSMLLAHLGHTLVVHQRGGGDDLLLQPQLHQLLVALLLLLDQLLHSLLAIAEGCVQLDVVSKRVGSFYVHFRDLFKPTPVIDKQGA